MSQSVLSAPYKRVTMKVVPKVILSERVRVVLVLVVALFQGLLHLVLLPPWQHYDEPTHFEHAWVMANRNLLRPDETNIVSEMRRELAASMLEHDFYNGLTQPNLLAEGEGVWVGVPEFKHPPVYYLLVSVPLRFATHMDLTTQLYVARLVSLALFLATVAVTAGVMRELTPPDHTLRWLVPLALALLPPFASHMTAVNNDAGSVLALSFFTWGAVRTVRLGLTWRRVLWVISGAILSVLTKTTAAIALVLVPLVLVMGWWVWRGWRWRWLGGVAVIGVLLGSLAMMDWGDAAYWYREQFQSAQSAATRQEGQAPFGDSVLMIEAVPEERYRRLLNPFLREDVQRARGQMVTVGGWLWADRAVVMAGPGLMWDEATDETVTVEYAALEVSTEPTLVTRTFFLPEPTGVAYYAVVTEQWEPNQTPFTVYLDGAFAIVGEVPAGAEVVWEDEAVVVNGERRPNLVRNGSAEEGWPRLRFWVEQTLVEYARRSPSYLLSALLDVDRNGKWLTTYVARWLLYDFFSAFAWGHVRLNGMGWAVIRHLLAGVAVLGAIKWLAQSLAGRKLGLYPALAVLAGIAALVWLNAVLYPLPFTWGRFPMPVGRYLYAAIVPMALLLAGGWWAVWPHRLRPYGIWGLVALLGLMNVLSVALIWNRYYGT